MLRLDLSTNDESMMKNPTRRDDSQRSNGNKSSDDEFDIEKHVSYPLFYQSDDSNEDDDYFSDDDDDEALKITLSTEDADEDEMYLKECTKAVPARFRRMDIQGFFESENRNVGRLVELLKSESRDFRIWKKISITDQYDATTDGDLSNRERAMFLAIVGLAMNCAENLTLEVTTLDWKLFSVLKESLGKATCLEEFALRLPITHVRAIRIEDAAAFADGLATSLSLTSLSLINTSFIRNSVSPQYRSNSGTGLLSALFDGLKRNNSHPQSQSKKARRLCHFGDVTSSKRDETYKNVIENLTITAEMTEQALIKFGEYLGDGDCKVKTLKMNGCVFHSFPPDFQRVKNETVEWFAPYNCCLSNQGLRTFCAVFPHLRVLHLNHNCIDDLSPLDPLLLGDSATLQQLSLAGNVVREEQLIKFAGRIPQMKTLRSIVLDFTPFQDPTTAMAYFLDNILKNKSLSDASATYFKHPLELDSKKAVAALHWMNVNQGGRRGIQVESAGLSIPTALWPRILFRCLTRKYHDRIFSNMLSGTTRETISFGVLFSLLQENAYIFDEVPRYE